MTNTIQHGDVKFFENGDITTKVTYVMTGYGINAQQVWGKRITTFSISDGVIKDNEWISPKCFYRH